MNKFINFISEPWAWYVSGPFIAFIMFLLLYVGKNFGVSSTLRTFCAAGGAGKNNSFFDFDWKAQLWNVVFVIGAVIGGFIANQYLNNGEPVQVAASTAQDLQELSISVDWNLAPIDFFSWKALLTVKGFIVLVIGGFLVGFGARWAGGCTSGHAISGLSNFQLPSLIAVIGFFLGGLTMTHIIFPILFN